MRVTWERDMTHKLLVSVVIILIGHVGLDDRIHRIVRDLLVHVGHRTIRVVIALLLDQYQ